MLNLGDKTCKKNNGMCFFISLSEDDRATLKNIKMIVFAQPADRIFNLAQLDEKKSLTIQQPSPEGEFQ